MNYNIKIDFECEKDFLFLSIDNAVFADSTDETAITNDLKIEITESEIIFKDSEFNTWTYDLPSVTCFTITKKDTNQCVQVLNGRTVQLIL